MSLNFDSLPEPKFRYSPAVRMGPFVKTAGMVGLDPESNALVAGGAGSEFRQILENLRGFMRDNDLSPRQLVTATIYATAFHRFPELNAAWDDFVGDTGHFPARTAVGVSQLPVGAQVEADFLFYNAPSGGRPS